mmetsp:Transcript_56663/g.165772  ORF Transcript_56663/g.165772 Transcript_56663/m.165772 type:complete len:265 (-) Transcript_56663:105-899(-)
MGSDLSGLPCTLSRLREAMSPSSRGNCMRSLLDTSRVFSRRSSDSPSGSKVMWLLCASSTESPEQMQIDGGRAVSRLKATDTKSRPGASGSFGSSERAFLLRSNETSCWRPARQPSSMHRSRFFARLSSRRRGRQPTERPSTWFSEALSLIKWAGTLGSSCSWFLEMSITSKVDNAVRSGRAASLFSQRTSSTKEVVHVTASGMTVRRFLAKLRDFSGKPNSSDGTASNWFACPRKMLQSVSWPMEAGKSRNSLFDKSILVMEH